jgi:hypothetical protein
VLTIIYLIIIIIKLNYYIKDQDQIIKELTTNLKLTVTKEDYTVLVILVAALSFTLAGCIIVIKIISK